jgi:hypothetical protein
MTGDRLKRPGRPPLTPDEESVHLSVRLSAKQFDDTQRQATEARLSMAEWVRQMLAQGFVPRK